MFKVKNVALLLAGMSFVGCAGLDIKNISNLANMVDSQPMTFHDAVIANAKETKTPASSFVDSYMGTFQRDAYEKFKDDELTYEKEIKRSTQTLQNTIDGFQLKPYKIQYNITFGKYDTAKECFEVPDFLTEDGYLSDGNYYGIQMAPLVINSDKSKVKILPVAKFKPKNKNQITCIKVPKNLAGQITALGGETSRNTEVRLDYVVEKVQVKSLKFRSPKAPDKHQYKLKIDPGFEDIVVQGYEIVFNVKTIKVMKPGYSDQLLTLYNVE